ncbi:DUF2953 domain-containing protein [Clostridium psychrophilum]|uniref:DUF2953 domain-containing protein n=1 Tax=Clostridium psychrophilum TaxID=132926 RepID=UPI001C0B3404|nr:DUF2953 domain-containing protein [Clostridium psychrophilum]MBU3180439.1 DUF2953 domain-containing protein [Clostridium psychrophilum]
MFKYIIMFLLALIILLFPIPIKITLKYLNKVLEIYLYNKKLKLKKVSKIDSKKNSESNPPKKILQSLNFYDIKLIIYKIKNLKFKPTIFLNTKVEYGFDDAAFVAILFGLIHSIYGLLYDLLIKFVKVKNIDFKVIPHFKENNLNMEISCIIYINLAKVVNISFVIFLCLIKIKHNKVNIKKYKGGSIHG